jgi:hypothetical protein
MKDEMIEPTQYALYERLCDAVIKGDRDAALQAFTRWGIETEVVDTHDFSPYGPLICAHRQWGAEIRVTLTPKGTVIQVYRIEGCPFCVDILYYRENKAKVYINEEYPM